MHIHDANDDFSWFYLNQFAYGPDRLELTILKMTICQNNKQKINYFPTLQAVI